MNSRNYYRCKEAKKGCKAIIKVKYDIILQNAEMAYLSEHNHPLITPCRVTKETYKDVDSFINNNDGAKPKQIHNFLMRKLENEELHEVNTQIPSTRQLSHRISKFIHDSFPSPDHIWNAILSHGKFDGSSHFIKFFSFFPFFVIISTEDGMARLMKPSPIHFIDSTHSTCIPSMHLLCIMTLYQDRGKYLFLQLFILKI